MIFQDRTYAVLIVSSSVKFCDALRMQLPGSVYWPVDVEANASAARRALLGRVYDLILINTPLTDEFGTQFAIDVCEKTSSCVLLFVKNDLIDEVHAKGVEFGVATIPKPTSGALVTQSLQLLCAQRERFLRMEERQRSMEDLVAEMHLINRAKWLLIEKQGLTEADAHRFVEKQAMDERVTRREAARQIISMYE